MNEVFERISSLGLMPNMILYLMRGYNMEAIEGSNVLFIWSAVTHALAIFGAFLSDAYLGRFRVIALGSFSSLTVSRVLVFCNFFFFFFCFPGKLQERKRS